MNAASREALLFGGNVSSGLESRSILLAFRGTFRQKLIELHWRSRRSPLRHPSTMAPTTRPFEGVRVLELGTYLAAPLATLHLAGLAASVCAVVRPDDSRGATSERGAWLRLGPPPVARSLNNDVPVAGAGGKKIFNRHASSMKTLLYSSDASAQPEDMAQPRQGKVRRSPVRVMALMATGRRRLHARHPAR